jgi:hypothetical protein
MMSPRIHLTDFLLFQQMAASLRMFPLQGRKILCRRHDTCSFAFRTLKSPICGFCLIKLLLVMALFFSHAFADHAIWILGNSYVLNEALI